ncbi:SAM-dependent methyltransferase [Streptomyces sp. H39-S7]|uniref:SAM-dependent methyltransferase n=1 Tax=Streptomyces sp. H39-S7 TaxID=3004357 RepID=UPI0022AF7709|nr:SAM-dependent methyltransferase [Streptomyces sp. H39-S7]MCZ4122497.1 SAM-dependent methyltransferase [Streptomyces sp. H39-S7]
MTHPTPIRRSRRPRLLDAYCCQGGAGKGYNDAGFDITGIDLNPQPSYPFTFIQGGAVAFIREHGAKFDAIHASPPCQHDSDCQRLQNRDHPDLIAPTRAALESTGRPWVMENVKGALPKLHQPVMLCGAMFGLETYRHRYFETGGGFTFTAPAHPVHTAPQAKMGRPVPPGWYGQYVGNFSGVDLARRVMGVPWMNRDGIRECIPPAYSAWIGTQLLTSITPALEVAA